MNPLSDTLRPRTLEEVVGQEALLDTKTGALGVLLTQRFIPSMILWGPPGSGKTTIARLISNTIPDGVCIEVSAVSSGIGPLKTIIAQAKNDTASTIVFIDEIHRFNKSQQDVLLHAVEEGVIILIGATTENPSFEINSALLSRVQVFVLNALSDTALQSIWDRAELKLAHVFSIEEEVKQMILNQVQGDARRLLNILEQLYYKQQQDNLPITSDILEHLHLYIPSIYDKKGEQHYNLISALHKSVRGSDCDAALYWFARMLEGGEDPRYIGRRLLRMSYEDVGLADVQVSQYVLHAIETFERLGSPEGELALACAVIYLALSPKSNSAYMAYHKVRDSSKQHGHLPPPLHIRNAPTSLMKKIGYGKGYVYDHDTEEGFSGQNYFPDDMNRNEYYQPKERGFEREMHKRLQYFNALRNNKKHS